MLEFPAPRLIEYGGARLLHRTLEPWLDRQTDRLAIEADVAACGVDYDHLKATLLAQDQGLTNLLQTRVAEIVEKVKREPASFSLGLAQLQAGFGDHTGGGEHPTLPHAAVPQRLQSARRACVDRAWDQIRNRVGGSLHDWQKGPRYALEFLSELRARLIGSKEVLPGLMSQEPVSPGINARALDELRDDLCLRLLLLSKRALNDAGEALRGELTEYVTVRLERAVAQAMATGKDVTGLPVPGVLETLEERVNTLSRRVGNLHTALVQYAAATRTRTEVLAQPPVVNGVCLMGRDTAERVYAERLAPNGDATALATAEKARGAVLLGRLTDLAAQITEIDQPSVWDSAVSPTAGASAVPVGDRDQIEAAAREPFRSLHGRNVFGEWLATTDRQGVARECVGAADLLVSPDRTRAAQLKNGAPLTSVDLLIRPDEHSMEFDREVGAGQAWKALQGGEPTRAIFLREVYCIPPEALRGITSTPDHVAALETAAFDGYYTFTRKDVSWGPMSEGEWLRLEKFEQILAIAIQIGRARVSGGALLIDDYPRQSMGDPPQRKLRRHFPEAIRQWALIGLDNENLDLAQLEITLIAAIGNKIRAQGGEQFVGRLNEGLMYAPEGITGWDTRRIGDLFSEFCINDAILKPYYDLLFAPPAHVLEAMWCEAGQKRVAGRPVDAAGYYCISTGCGGLIGKSRSEAAEKGWRCPTCNADYSIRGQVDPDWVVQAGAQKAASGPQLPAPQPENGRVARSVFEDISA